MAQFTGATFASFYESTSRPLWRYAYHVTGNAADADDIVQDAFCRVLQAEVGALSEEERRRYLFRVAGHLMTDGWRRQQRQRFWSLRSPPETTTTNDRVDERSDEVTRTFAVLKPRERALLWLAYVEEYDHERIAEALGIGRASVKVLLFRARARLRDLLSTSTPSRSREYGSRTRSHAR
jgi:RNA polymerase sigma-70 factor (ECF subfamily)